jgi:hypothetical protein
VEGVGVGVFFGSGGIPIVEVGFGTGGPTSVEATPATGAFVASAAGLAGSAGDPQATVKILPINSAVAKCFILFFLYLLAVSARYSYILERSKKSKGNP